MKFFTVIVFEGFYILNVAVQKAQKIASGKDIIGWIYFLENSQLLGKSLAIIKNNHTKNVLSSSLE